MVLCKDIPLYVPKGTKELYQSTDGWKDFTNIIERGLEPVDSNEELSFAGSDFNADTNLEGNVIDNFYYNIPAGAGGYNTADGCITLQVSVSDEQLESIVGKDVYDADVKENFKGIAFLLPAGSGTITIDAVTMGGTTLKVKIGESDPVEKQLDGRQKVTFSYETATTTYAYICAGGTAAAKGMYANQDTENNLKIYGITLSTETPTGIAADSLSADDSAKSARSKGVYTLQGVKVADDASSFFSHPSYKKGIYIVNGKKVMR